jgi:hypothetical protein
MLEIIKRYNLPLDRIIHSEIMATSTIPADLPPMMEFKKKADRIIKERYGIDVEHIRATNIDGVKKDCVSYEDGFYHIVNKRNGTKVIKGFPMQKGNWCTKLKTNPLDEMVVEGDVYYLGIACDEPLRVDRYKGKKGYILPLAEYNITEAECREICEELGLLSPIYTSVTRGGCWFCHNQRAEQLRLLRKNYPYLWEILLKWDKDSPVTFKSDGHTVHDFDRRFELEEQGLVPSDRTFKWAMLDGPWQGRLIF